MEQWTMGTLNIPIILTNAHELGLFSFHWHGAKLEVGEDTH